MEQLTLDNLPPRMRARFERMSIQRGVSFEEYAQPLIDAQNARWRKVGYCPRCPRKLIEGELIPHWMNSHISARSRSVARDFIALTPERRAEILSLFDADGEFVPQVTPDGRD